MQQQNYHSCTNGHCLGVCCDANILHLYLQSICALMSKQQFFSCQYSLRLHMVSVTLTSSGRIGDNQLSFTRGSSQNATCQPAFRLNDLSITLIIFVVKIAVPFEIIAFLVDYKKIKLCSTCSQVVILPSLRTNTSFYSNRIIFLYKPVHAVNASHYANLLLLINALSISDFYESL